MRRKEYKSSIYAYIKDNAVDLPKGDPSIEEWSTLVQKFPRILLLVPKAIQTKEMILSAVEQEGLTVQFANEGLIDRSIAYAAIQQDVRSIAFIPISVMDEDLVVKAVGSEGLLLSHVADQLQTEAIVLAAVKSDGRALEFVRSDLRTETICTVAFESDASSLAFAPPENWNKEKALLAAKATNNPNIYYALARRAPSESVTEDFIVEVCSYRGKNVFLFDKSLRTEETYLAALNAENPVSLYKIPRRSHTEAIVKSAIANNPKHIKYAAKGFDTKEMRQFAKTINPRRFWQDGKSNISPAGPPEQLEKQRSLSAYFDLLLCELEQGDLYISESDRCSIQRRRPYEFRDAAPECMFWKNKYILWLLLYFRSLKVADKRVNLDDSACDIDIEIGSLFDYGSLCDIPVLKTVHFNKIKSALDYLNGDLSGTGLEGYNLEEEKRKAESEKFFFGSIAPFCCTDESGQDQESAELEKADRDLAEIRELQEIARDEPESRFIYYVSDIHIDHNIAARFSEGVSKAYANAFVHQIIVRMIGDNPIGKRDYLFIGGDVADRFPAVEMFYENLVKVSNGATVVAILGNHELWDFGPHDKYMSESIDETISKYRTLFERLGIKYLENDMLVVGGKQSGKIYREKDLRNIDEKELIRVSEQSQLLIYGGVGFTGLNDRFNAESGLYREAMSSRKEDIERSQRFCELHDMFQDLIPDSKFVVFSHTKTGDWTNRAPNPNWIYVRGHDHRNFYRCDEFAVIYADNQTGYKREPYLKRFTFGVDNSPFRRFKDGIYRISRQQYIAFCRSRFISMEFNRDIGELFLIKKARLHMFFCTSPKSGQLYLLDGGRINTANHNLSYYFENMDRYAELVKRGFAPYEEALESLSDNVRKFGGWGTIHGCIVDIDFCTHIFLNPFDGTATPYYALDTQECVAYEDIEMLLTERCPQLLPAYNDSLANRNSILQCQGAIGASGIKRSAVSTGAKIYSVSRKMSKVRYLFTSDVIRFWSDVPLRAQTNQPYQNNRVFSLPSRMLGE